jgi:microcin C transport system ATP-binding protein
MSSLLELRGLHVAFGATEAVRGIDLTVQPGEVLALVGESGSGKSVTALAALGLLPPSARVQAQALAIDGRPVTPGDDSTLRRLRGNRVGMIFQEPMTALNPLHSIGRQIGEAITIHNPQPADAVRARVLELLAQVAISPDKLDCYPHELSGGQRQRAMIAMALANKPALLVADEPTTALDVTVQKQILDLLLRLRDDTGMGLLLITHDLNLVRRYADRVAVMCNGGIVETAPTATLFRAPAHPYTQELLAAEPGGAPLPVAADAASLLQVENLRVWFPVKRGFLRRTVGHVKAVTDISFALREGETLGIVGESGSGKTTAALALLRLTAATGNARFEGRELLALSAGEMRPLRRRLQVVFQDPWGSLSPRLSVADIVAEGLDLYEKLTPAERDARVCAALEETGLDSAARYRYPHEFSGGQRQRIAIARALVLKPRLLVLDEPTSALDRSVQAQLVALLRDLQARHRLSYLFISHDLRVVRALAHRVLVLRNGEVIEQGEADQVFAAPQADYTRELLAAAFTDPDGR